MTAATMFAIAAVAAGCASAPTTHKNGDSGNTVTAADAQQANESLEYLLEKKVPGLVVLRGDGGSVALQIRGRSSFDGTDRPPLYILNGLPFDPGPGGVITGVSLNDIESVKVLKGAEAGLYGIDGANGVIVITTKLGAGKK
jgi:TonB-dependent SusC/RagA subfamily outer membrane receptor